MPLDAWLLLTVAVGLGLALEVRFFLARRRDRRSGPPGAIGAEATPEDGP